MAKCFHCELEYQKPTAPSCWEKCAQKGWMCKDCKEYMKECIYAWNRAHGLKVNGEPPGEIVTKGQLWDKYHNSVGAFPKSPGIQHKEINE